MTRQIKCPKCHRWIPVKVPPQLSQVSLLLPTYDVSPYLKQVRPGRGGNPIEERC